MPGMAPTEFTRDAACLPFFFSPKFRYITDDGPPQGPVDLARCANAGGCDHSVHIQMKTHAGQSLG